MTKLNAMRWVLPASAIRAVEHNEDGSVSVLAELYRPDRIGRFHLTKEFVTNTFPRWIVDLVDTHDADLDANTSHIGGATAPVEIEKGTHATLATLKTYTGPTGLQMASILREHEASIKAGGRAIATLSIGAHDVEFAKGQGPGVTDPPWDVVDGKPDHVMLVRAGYQAQENAGIRVAATLEEALDTEADRLINAADDSEPMSDDSQKLDQLRLDLKASQEAVAAANTAREEAEKATAEAQEATAKLQGDKDDAERSRLLDEITGIHKDLDTKAPATADWDLERTRVEHMNALQLFRKEAPGKLGVKGGPVPPNPEGSGDGKDKEPKGFAVSGTAEGVTK